MSVPDIFYTPPENTSSDKLYIKNSELHHLKKVHRKKTGDIIVVVNGRGSAWSCEISDISDHCATAVIIDSLPDYGEADIELTLAVGIPKRTKFEWILEKGTELGVCHFIPLLTERTLMKPGYAKMERWQKILIAAMKQCQRSRIPQITKPISFERFVADESRNSVKFIAHEKTRIRDQLWQKTIANTNAVTMCIGPEGGFGDNEMTYALENGFLSVSLGVRRLRTETAAIAAISIIMAMLNN